MNKSKNSSSYLFCYNLLIDYFVITKSNLTDSKYNKIFNILIEFNIYCLNA